MKWQAAGLLELHLIANKRRYVVGRGQKYPDNRGREAVGKSGAEKQCDIAYVHGMGELHNP